jgi:hypothetical protein
VRHAVLDGAGRALGRSAFTRLNAVRRKRLARDILHDRHGALADERDRHWMGAHAVACDAAGGVAGRGPHRIVEGGGVDHGLRLAKMFVRSNSHAA